MRSSKILATLLPTSIGLLILICILQLRQSIINYDLPFDDTMTFDPLFDFRYFIWLYLVIFIFAITFQYFVSAKIWSKYKNGEKFFGLNLRVLVSLSSLLFGIISGIVFSYNRPDIQNLLVNATTWTGLALVYWSTNLLVLNFIDNRKYGS